MVIYGKQLILHMLNKHSKKIKKIFLSKECDKAIFNKIRSLNIEFLRIDNKKAQALSKNGNHQGFLAEVDDFVFSDLKDIKTLDFLVILYGLSDVGNIGAICRSAYALGADAIVYIGKNINLSGVVRTSSGAIYEIPFCMVEDGANLLNELKQSGFYLYATAKDGEEIFKFQKKMALILGSEGYGLSNKVINKCDKSIAIKMKHNWDSLNVSAAFAIFCDRIINGR